MQVYSSDKISPRSFPWLWYVRLVAIIATFVVLGITASNTATFHNIGCDAPDRLSYNLAVAILSFVVLVYFILASGPSRATRLLPWFLLGQLALDGIMFILWLCAGATSSYSCADLCNACGIDNGYVYFDTEACECATFYYKRDYSPRPRNMLQTRKTHANSRRDESRVVGTIAAKQAFDAVMTVLFAFFIAADIFWLLKSRRSAVTTTAPGPATGVPMKTEEAGVYNSNNNQMTAPPNGYAGQSYGAPSPPPQSMPQQQQTISPISQYPPAHPQPPYPAQNPYPQTYTSPQGEYPPQYAGSNTQYARYPDGVSEMHSPTEVPKMSDGHQV